MRLDGLISAARSKFFASACVNSVHSQRGTLYVTLTAVPTVTALHMTIGPTGVKWPRREADHSTSSSAGVKKEWSYIPLPYTSSQCGRKILLSTFFCIKPRNGGIDYFTFSISLPTFVTKITQNKVMTKFSKLQHALHRCIPRVTLI